MAEDMGDKTELPTQRRLSEARERGQVAKSTDLAAAIDLIGALIVIMALGGWAASSMAGIMRSVLGGVGESVAWEAVAPVLRQSFFHMGKAMVPALLILAGIAALAHVVQVGLHFSPKVISLKWSRLNPVNGVGQLVSRRNLVKTIVNSVKCGLVILVGYLVISGLIGRLVALPTLTTAAAFKVIGSALLELTLWLLAVLLVLGLADFAYQRWQHTRDLKMTKADVKDERRAMEGDPQVKAARFKMMQKIALQRVNSAVPKADVVVTNPTHYSIAIQYDATKMRAPRVVAKGVDFLAMRIREVALTHGVPMVERPPLARALYAAVEVGQEVREEHYQAVAEILAFVYRLEEEEKARAAAYEASRGAAARSEDESEEPAAA